MISDGKVDREPNGAGTPAGENPSDPADHSGFVPDSSSTADTAEILRNADSLRELGMVDAAVEEYSRLFARRYPLSKIIPGLLGCLSRSKSPRDTLKRIDDAVEKQKLPAGRMAGVKYFLGLEMEKGGQFDLALSLFEEAEKSDPQSKQIKDKIDLIVAKLSSGSRYDYLLFKGMLTQEILQQAAQLSKKMQKSLEFVLVNHFKLRKEEVGKSLSLYFGCPFRGFDPNLPVPVELIGGLKKAFLLHDLWVPLSWSKEGVEIIIDNPGDLRKTGQIRALIKTKKAIFHVGIKEDIEQFITHFFDRKSEDAVKDMMDELDMIPDVTFEMETEEEEQREEDMVDEESSQVVKLVDQIIVAAYRKGVSDIHVEPSLVSKKTTIRFRLDGVCQEYAAVPNSMARGILSRLKIMANLDIAERRLPQDGKIKFRRKGIPTFELRMATIPTADNQEDAVLRILAKAGALKLSDMGLNERNERILKKLLTQPYGIILAVGPTGSGKTTTLHSALGHINDPGIKIWTAEDPVEITQAGLRQVEVKPKIGLDFARVMRSFLRADPDVIMIGEMRDHETAGIGIEASLTGHLVLSTLHTNSAPETVTRLLDMGLNPLNFSDALLGVLAQRLVRRLCPTCKEAYHPSREEFDEMVSQYGSSSFEKTGIAFSSDLVLYKRTGCEQCSGTGYRGRLGIHELLEGTPAIKQLIKKAASTEELFLQATKEGMTTLKQDGIDKVFKGLTDMKEVGRVCID